ncbi:MAG: peptide ABC transporter substrate-binding protein [Opitutae bacterium]|nr:peptide ABC transporter substrate-binding protein [Opitutae bacterium]
MKRPLATDRIRPFTGIIFCASLCLFVAIQTGCAKRESAVALGNRTGVLHFSIGSEPTDLDPQIVTGIGEAKVIHALFEPLVSFDPRTLKPVPALAERWEISPDGLTYTFHLRADAVWSNGDPLTAQDCVDSWRRILTPSLGADYAYLFYVLRGAEDFHKGRTTDFATVGVAAPDAHTFVATLTHPAPYFLQILLNSPWRPVNVRRIAEFGNAYQRGTPWTRVGRIVTSGPFVLKEWTPHQRLVAEKSPTYWDLAHVYLNAIHFYPTDSVDAEERAFRAGQLHITYTLSLSKIAAYRRDHPALLRTDPYLNTYFFRFNTRRAPLDDERVRRALSLAIDRTAIAAKVLAGGQQPAPTLVPAATPGYTPPARPDRDLPVARRLLAEAGYPEGRGAPPLEILYNNSETIRLVAESIQEMWRRDLGLNVTLQNQEYKVVFANRRAGNFQILLSDWVGDYLDATTFLDLLRSDAGNNHTGWGDPAYDALLDRANATVDTSARAALLQQAEALMLDHAPIAPLYFNPHVYLIQPSVKNWHPNPMDHADYRYVRLEN